LNALLSTRKLAEKRGKKTYVGGPCKNCGSTERRVSSARCIACAKAQDRNSKLINRYNITEKEYLDMLKKQKNCCKICGIHKKNLKRSLAVDHCHSTDKVRGLLCINCNRGMGYLQDDIEMLKSAIKYLEEYQ
jgi:nitrate/TMAO reductase-like tetraheme cytochrome c subunit